MKQKYNLRDVLEFYENNELNEIFSSEPNDKLKIDGKPLIVLNKKTKENSRETNLILGQEVQKEKLPDHLKIQESTIVSNLKPICQNCNSSMGTINMNEFMKSLK